MGVAIDQGGLEKKILEFMVQKAKGPKTFAQIRDALGLGPKEGLSLSRSLKKLVTSGGLIRLRGGSFAAPSNLRLIVGRFELSKGKSGIVMPEDPQEPQIVIPVHARMGAIDADRVVARLEGRLENGQFYGSVVRILERGLKEAIGVYHERGRLPYVEVIGLKEGFEVVIEEPPKFFIEPHALVRVRITGYPKGDSWAVGIITEVVGDKDALEPYIEAILVNSAIPRDFSEGALKEAKGLPTTLPENELEGRKDLTDLPFVTIDGETAKDFDDAVCFVPEKGGLGTLYVAIADVAHYVKEGGEIDREAMERGTSVYYPGRVVPMLPFELSWGLCSLNPNEVRPVMVVELGFNLRGGLKKRGFYPALIKSLRRLTYTQVNALFSGDSSPFEGEDELKDRLFGMERLARALHALRLKKGSLDFDLPETLVMLSQEGDIEGIIRGERGWAERLIEEFMIAANVAVAKFLMTTGTPCLYRIHEPPDPKKLNEFLAFIKARGVRFDVDPKKKKLTPKDLSRFLEAIQGRQDERILHYMLLRSLMRAQYHPKPKGHFGLALGAYAHFTSPIRRYPDLFVHRMLKARLLDHGSSFKWPSPGSVLDLAQKTSKAEQRATEVERAIVDLYKVFFIKDRLNETFTGYISSVLPFGFFVELDEVFLEGLVHISQIGDDYYIYDERRARLIGENTGRVFALGDRVSVQVARASLKDRQIDFILAEEPGVREPRKRRGKPGIRKSRPQKRRQ